MLKKLEIGDVSASINCNCCSAIRCNNSIEKLKLDNVTDKCVTNIAKLIEQNQKLTEMTLRIERCRQSPSAQATLVIANSLTVNKSVKMLKYGDESVKQPTVLKFLEHLKQAYAIEEITFGVSLENNDDDEFLQNIEMTVQQINHTRCVSNLLKVKIVTYHEL